MESSPGRSPPSVRLAGRARAAGRLRAAFRRAIMAGLLLGAGRVALAEVAAAPPAGCDQAAAQAERVWNLPAGLLGAIGRAESGRRDSLTGLVEPWPFAVNVAGTGYFFASADDAVAFVQRLQNGGARSIDVGCFQINLLHHPAAFASLAAGFDAAANATAAAQFLSELHQRSGDWGSAVGRYHSALPERGEPYRARVLATWQGGSAPMWLPRAAAPEPPGGDPHVILLTASASSVVVVTPAAAGARAAPIGRSGALPRVFVPE